MLRIVSPSTWTLTRCSRWPSLENLKPVAVPGFANEPGKLMVSGCFAVALDQDYTVVGSLNCGNHREKSSARQRQIQTARERKESHRWRPPEAERETQQIRRQIMLGTTSLSFVFSSGLEIWN